MSKRKAVVGLDVDLAKTHTFSAATLIQNQPSDSDTWSDIVLDLERALAAARRVADTLARAEDGAKR